MRQVCDSMKIHRKFISRANLIEELWMHILTMTNWISGTWVTKLKCSCVCATFERKVLKSQRKVFELLQERFDDKLLLRQSTSVKERQTRTREDQMFTLKSPKVNFLKLIPVISYACIFTLLRRKTEKIINQFKFISFRDSPKVIMDALQCCYLIIST